MYGCQQRFILLTNQTTHVRGYRPVSQGLLRCNHLVRFCYLRFRVTRRGTSTLALNIRSAVQRIKDDNMSRTQPSSSAMALREAFGDRNPVVDISRKITACVACRKLKIRCNMERGQAPCSRCRKRGLSCTVNKSLQMLLEDDASWKDRVEHKMSGLEAAISKVAEKISCPELLDLLRSE